MPIHEVSDYFFFHFYIENCQVKGNLVLVTQIEKSE